MKLKSSNYVEEDKPWLKIKVPKRCKIDLHEHSLTKMPNTEDDQWACNGIEVFKTGCYGGITDFYQTKGIKGWRCPIEECDFDICKTCVQYSIISIQKVKNQWLLLIEVIMKWHQI